MSKINVIGTGSMLTSSECVYGKMPGLAPTATVRSSVTGIHGYKASKTAANEIDWSTGNTLERTTNSRNSGCGLGKQSCTQAKGCVNHLKYTYPSSNQYSQYRVGSKLLG